MIVICPISTKSPGIEKFAADLKKKGSLPEHILHLVSLRGGEDEDMAYKIGDELAGSFQRVTTETVLPNPAKGQSGLAWANQMFVTAMRFFEGYEYRPNEVPEAPMLFLPTNFRPVTNGWLNDLQSEFFLKGAPPAMGRTTTSGKDRVTVGPVIFGRKCIGKLPTINTLDGKTHWRDWMKFEIAAGFHETKAIGPGSKSLLKEMPSVKVEA